MIKNRTRRCSSSVFLFISSPFLRKHPPCTSAEGVLCCHRFHSTCLPFIFRSTEGLIRADTCHKRVPCAIRVHYTTAWSRISRGSGSWLLFKKILKIPSAIFFLPLFLGPLGPPGWGASPHQVGVSWTYPGGGA